MVNVNKHPQKYRENDQSAVMTEIASYGSGKLAMVADLLMN